jgi:hypothetical protein
MKSDDARLIGVVILLALAAISSLYWGIRRHGSPSDAVAEPAAMVPSEKPATY